MPVLPVTDFADARLEPFRALGDAALLRQQGLFVAEGRLVVERVIADSRFHVAAMLLNTSSLAALGRHIEQVPEPTPIFVSDHAGFERLTGFDLHRGCLALVHRPSPLTLADAIGAGSLVVVLEGVTNADNVGSVFRSAAAFGVDAVLLNPTCCDPLYRKAIRTSMGAALTVPWARVAPWPDALIQLRNAGFTTVALSPRAPATTLDAFVCDRGMARLALLIGTEGEGLTPEAEAAADLRVCIPTTSAVDSLNLGVAAGIALSRLTRVT